MKYLAVLMVIGVLLVSGCVGGSDDSAPEKTAAKKTVLASEKSFYKMSDKGTDVVQLTSAEGHDSIFYQEPNYFSPDGSKFLFRSDRDGQYKLYILDVESGEITLLRDSTSFGWAPTWSADGKEVYVGQSGEILKVNVDTLKERSIKVPTSDWMTFLHVSPNGEKIVFIEEGRTTHLRLSVINTDGSEYKVLYEADQEKVFYLDHPIWLDDNSVFFLTRGANRDFTGDFNKPYIVTLDGDLKQLDVECSHYDVNHQGNKIICGTEGYVINPEGEILKSSGEIKGHGVWAPDGDTLLVTGDPVPVPPGSKYYGKIVVVKYSTNEIYELVSHENSYDSSLGVHIQPNAQFSPDGRYIIYESDKNTGSEKNIDLYMVEVA